MAAVSASRPAFHLIGKLIKDLFHCLVDNAIEVEKFTEHGLGLCLVNKSGNNSLFVLPVNEFCLQEMIHG